jgi:hypothetical protein
VAFFRVAARWIGGRQTAHSVRRVRSNAKEPFSNDYYSRTMAGRSRRIVFSNGSRRMLFRMSTLSGACVLCVLVRHLMG